MFATNTIHQAEEPGWLTTTTNSAPAVVTVFNPAGAKESRPMRLTIGTGGVPPGTYSGKFAGIKEYHHPEYGPGLMWRFEITSGAHVGRDASRVTSPTPTPNNVCGKMINQALGRPITPGEEVDLDDLVGREYLIEVRETPNGATRVEEIAPLDQTS